jgi:uracil-DNA glycosylase
MNQTIVREDLESLLRWYVEQGIDEAIGEEAIDRFAAPPPQATPLSVQPPAPPAPTPIRRAPAAPAAPAPLRGPVPIESPQLVEDARALAQRCNSVDELEAAVRAFDGCALKRTAKNTVFADGVVGSAVMIVGEAPGASADKQGRPFVGRAGRFLDQLLAEAGLEREQVYITNVVKARPPNNRDPRADEVAHHMPWLETQLALIQPSLVVPLGRHALAHFSDGAKISEVHGTEITERGRTLFPLYHPAAALHNQSLRETLVADAKALKKAMSKR